MTASENCKKIIKESEGLRLKAYRCPVGIPTIGYGHTKGVKMGDKITEEQAEIFLDEDLLDVTPKLTEVIHVPITQNQFDSLASFCFNIRGGVERFKDSTMCKKLNRKDYFGAADEFRKWDKGTVGDKLVQLKGLTIRREKERKLFLNEL